MHNRKSTIWLTFAMIILLALIIGCSDDDDVTTPPAGDTTESTIGASGGSLTRSGDANLVIPAGALSGTVDFIMGEDATPLPMGTGMDFATPVFNIGPSGTQFSSPAALTLNYNEEDLGGLPESTIVVCTHNGAGWVPLPTVIDETANTATAQINHLSDYCATIPIGEDAEGVYAILELVRAVNYAGFVDFDIISARFDTIVDPCNVHFSLQPDSVYCNDFKLAYNEMTTSYLDQETTQEFLELGFNYEFEVFGNTTVPDLVQTITFPDVAPMVTNIINSQTLSLGGFTVEWNDTDGNDVLINLITDNDQVEVVSIETENDGSYTFTEAQLENLVPGEYVLDLRYRTVEFIAATGYDPHSTIGAGTTNITLVMLTAGGGIGAEGGILPLDGDISYLEIPDGALTSEVNFTASVNSTPTATPDGWLLVTPVYTIEPSGTNFAINAILELGYDENDLNDNNESTIQVFTEAGSGWVQLTTDVFEDRDAAVAEIDHLSDFAAFVEIQTVADGVYCEMLINRTVVFADPDVVRIDGVTVRFDDTVASEAVNPMDADGLTFDESPMFWDEIHLEYVWGPPTLGLGDSYVIVVDGDEDVPDLTQTITFIPNEAYLTNLATGNTVNLAGFDVEWGVNGTGRVRIIVTQGDDIPIYEVETDNDGAYSITAANLSGATSGMIGLELKCISTGAIDAVGYDEASYWEAFSSSFVALIVQ